MEKIFRIGHMVPSSNTGIKAGMSWMPTARHAIRSEPFTFPAPRSADVILPSACAHTPSLPEIARVEAILGAPPGM